MGSIGFVVRSLIVTFVVILLMQIRWQGRTLEDHTMSFLTTAAITTPIDETATGAVVFIRNSWTKMSRMLDTNFTKALIRENRPGARQEKFKVSRSEKSEKSEKAEKIDETYVPGQSDASSVDEE